MQVFSVDLTHYLVDVNVVRPFTAFVHLCASTVPKCVLQGRKAARQLFKLLLLGRTLPVVI
jgi:hypothetical protein